MDYVALGRTGLQVSRVCLGCMSYGQATTPGILHWHWTLSEADSRPHIQRAIEAGINFVDTANVYSNGESEAVVGRALKDFARRDEGVIGTKVWGSPDWARCMLCCVLAFSSSSAQPTRRPEGL